MMLLPYVYPGPGIYRTYIVIQFGLNSYKVAFIFINQQKFIRHNLGPLKVRYCKKAMKFEKKSPTFDKKNLVTKRDIFSNFCCLLRTSQLYDRNSKISCRNL